jgi:hypothetical protein
MAQPAAGTSPSGFKGCATLQPHLNAMDFRPCSGQPFAQMNKSGTVGLYNGHLSESRDKSKHTSSTEQEQSG